MQPVSVHASSGQGPRSRLTVTIQEPFRDNVIRRPLKVDGPASPGAQEWNPSSLEGREGIGCSWGSILCCAEKTALEEQAGAARSTDRRETRGMSHIGQCTLRSGVLNRECPWMRPILQSGHGVAAARQGIGRATRIGPSDGPQVFGGWKNRTQRVLDSRYSSFLLPDQQGDRRPPVHRQELWRCEDRV